MSSERFWFSIPEVSFCETLDWRTHPFLDLAIVGANSLSTLFQILLFGHPTGHKYTTVHFGGIKGPIGDADKGDHSEKQNYIRRLILKQKCTNKANSKLQTIPSCRLQLSHHWCIRLLAKGAGSWGAFCHCLQPGRLCQVRPQMWNLKDRDLSEISDIACVKLKQCI